MKTKASIIAALAMSFFTPAFLPSCATGPTANQQQDIRNLSTVATAAAFAATKTADRPKLAADLVAASSAIELLTGEGATAEDIRKIVTSYTGKAQPEYIILATVLADYVTRYTASGTPAQTREVLHLVAQGIQTAAAAYAK